MNLQTLPLIDLHWAPPPEELIDGQVLLAQLTHEAELNCTEKEAAALLNSARRKAEQLVRQAKKEQQELLVVLESKEEEMKKVALQDSETEWLEKHVRWIVHAESWEQELVERVAERIHTCMEAVLTSWYQQQPQDTTLIARLSKQVELMVQEENLMLHVNPCHGDKARAHFAERLKVVEDPSLEEDQGVLTSVLLTVEISLSRHFEQLISWLRAKEEGMEETDHAD